MGISFQMRTTYVLFFLVGFISDFTALAEFYLLRDLGLDVAECYMAGTLIDSPWSLRPWLGNVSDRLGRRNVQLAVVFSVAVVMCLSVFAASHSLLVIALLFLCETAAAIGLTVSDAFVVRMTKSDPMAMPKHQRMRILGNVAASLCSGALLTVPDKQLPQRTKMAFAAQAVVYLLSGQFAWWFVREAGEEVVSAAEEEEKEEATDGGDYDESRSYEWNVFHSAWRDKTVRLLILFATLASAMPSSGAAVSYFLVGPSVGLTPFTFAAVDMIACVGSFVGTMWDPRVDAALTLQAFSTTSVLLSIPILYMVCRVLHASVKDEYLLYISAAIGSVVSTTYGMTLAYHVSRIAPKGREGGAFSGVVSLPTIGRVGGVASTFALTKYFAIDHDEFSYLPSFVALTSTLNFIPTTFAFLYS